MKIESGTVSIRKSGWSLSSIPTRGKAHDDKVYQKAVGSNISRATNLTRDKKAVGRAPETYRKTVQWICANGRLIF